MCWYRSEAGGGKTGEVKVTPRDVRGGVVGNGKAMARLNHAPHRSGGGGGNLIIWFI